MRPTGAGHVSMPSEFRGMREPTLSFVDVSSRRSRYRLYGLNVAVYFPQADELWNGPPTKDKRAKIDCVVRQRIGPRDAAATNDATGARVTARPDGAFLTYAFRFSHLGSTRSPTPGRMTP